MTLATASIAAITSSISTINDNITLATASIAAITASLGQPVNTDSDVTFGDITSTGTITAVEVHTTFVSSSIAVISGSNNFGDEVAKRGRLSDTAGGAYWIYEVSTSDLNVNKNNPALMPVANSLGDNLEFAYPLVERQMASRSDISNPCFDGFI